MPSSAQKREFLKDLMFILECLLNPKNTHISRHINNIPNNGYSPDKTFTWTIKDTIFFGLFNNDIRCEVRFFGLPKIEKGTSKEKIIEIVSNQIQFLSRSKFL